VFVKSIKALQSSIGDLTDLLWVEKLPSNTIKDFIEGGHILNLFEVNESIANIALVLEINRQVEEVIETFVSLLYLIKQLIFIILVWYVLDHERCSAILNSVSWSHLKLGFLIICMISLLYSNLCHIVRDHYLIVWFKYLLFLKLRWIRTNTIVLFIIILFNFLYILDRLILIVLLILKIRKSLNRLKRLKTFILSLLWQSLYLNLFLLLLNDCYFFIYHLLYKLRTRFNHLLWHFLLFLYFMSLLFFNF
jgi:hypothetical protein